VRGQQAAVRKDGVVDDEHGAVARKLLRERPPGREQPHARAQRRLPRVVLVGGVAARAARGVHVAEQLLEAAPEARALLERARGHVPEVAADVQDLVVAVQHVHRAARLLRALRQALQQEEDAWWCVRSRWVDVGARGRSVSGAAARRSSCHPRE
jgi:hypothetical protein